MKFDGSIYSAIEHLPLNEAAALVLAHEEVRVLVTPDTIPSPPSSPSEDEIRTERLPPPPRAA